MKEKYVIVQEESLRNLVGVFSGQEEVAEFVKDLFVTMHLLRSLLETGEACESKAEASELTGKLLFVLAKFVRDNMDTIQQLTSKLDYMVCDEDEMPVVNKMIALSKQSVNVVDFKDMKKGQTP